MQGAFGAVDLAVKCRSWTKKAEARATWKANDKNLRKYHAAVTQRDHWCRLHDKAEENALKSFDEATGLDDVYAKARAAAAPKQVIVKTQVTPPSVQRVRQVQAVAGVMALGALVLVGLTVVR